MSIMIEKLRWWTVQEVADHLGVTDGRVRQFLLDGRLQGVKFGKSWAISDRELRRFSKIDRLAGTPGHIN